MIPEGKQILLDERIFAPTMMSGVKWPLGDVRVCLPDAQQAEITGLVLLWSHAHRG